MDIRKQIYRFIDMYVDTPEPKKLCSSIQDLVEELAEYKVKNIEVIRCSLQLKDGEVPSFAYWLKHHKYETTKDSNILTKNNNNFVRGELFKKYRTEYNF